MDPDCLIRRCSTRGHGPARNPSDGNSGRGSLSCRVRSHALRFKALALSPRRSSNLRPIIRFHYNATDKGGIGAVRLRRLQLADSPTLLLQRCTHRSDRILSNHTAGIPCDCLDFRAYRPSDRSVPRGRLVLFTAEPSQNTILLVRRELQELAKTCHP